MKVRSENEVAQSCLTLSNPMDCSLPDSSVHGIFQARVLEWVAIATINYLVTIRVCRVWRYPKFIYMQILLMYWLWTNHKEILLFVITWMNLERIMLYEVSPRKTNAPWPHLNVESNNNHEEQNINTENRLVVSRRGVWVSSQHGWSGLKGTNLQLYISHGDITQSVVTLVNDSVSHTWKLQRVGLKSFQHKKEIITMCDDGC